MKPFSFRSHSFYDSAKAYASGARLYVVSTASLLVGIGAQLLGFVILARFLGAEQFGRLMAITAVTAVALSICGLGADEVVIRRCVREPSLYPRLLGHSIKLLLLSGPLLSLVAVFVLLFLVHATASNFTNVVTLTIFAVSNIIFARFLMLTEAIFIARRKISYANIVVTGFSLARMSAAVMGCMIFGVTRLETWAIWHGGVHIAGSLMCVCLLWRYGQPQWGILPEEVWRGVHTVTPQLISTLRQNIDRMTLTAIASPVTVAAYSISSNMVQYSLVTINSFSRLFYPRLVMAGREGISSVRRLAAEFLLIIVAIGTINGIALFVISPLLPWLFGTKFTQSAHVLSVLCWLPIFVSIHNIAYDALGAAEKHNLRAVCYNTTGIVGIGLIGALTFRYGVSGALAGIFIAYTLLCVAMWVCLAVLVKDERPPL